MNSTALQLECDSIEDILVNSFFGKFYLYGQMPLLLITLILMGILVHQYFQYKIMIHGNLMLLFKNIVLVYFLSICGYIAWLLRYRILLFYYTDPCQLLTPLWMAALFYGPIYIHLTAYPALHFCVMVERFRATLSAEKYESEGRWLGILMVTIIWIISIAYLAFILIAAFNVPKMALQGMPYLTSECTSTPILVVNCVALGVVNFTAICDWRITVLNKKIRQQIMNYATYSLARNFQLNENSLAMRLILPMDIAYALIYSIYSIATIYLRIIKGADTITAKDFSSYYNFINTLLFLYTLFTIIVYIRFVKFMGKSQRRNVNMKSGKEEAKLYFDQLKALWQ